MSNERAGGQPATVVVSVPKALVKQIALLASAVKAGTTAEAALEALENLVLLLEATNAGSCDPDVGGNACKAVVATMRAFPAEPKLQEKCLEALAQLVRACRLLALEMSVVLTAMRDHTARVDLQQYGCHLLCQVLDGGPVSGHALLQASSGDGGGTASPTALSVLLAALAAHRSDSVTQRLALQALVPVLQLNLRVLREAAQAGAGEAALWALQMHTDDDVQSHGCLVLFLLGQHRLLDSTALVDAGAFATLLGVTRAGTEVARFAWQVLGMLIWGEELQRRALDAGVLGAAIAALRGAAGVDSALATCPALTHLAHYLHQRKDVAQYTDVAEGLLAAMDMYPNSEALHHNGISVLRMLLGERVRWGVRARDAAVRLLRCPYDPVSLKLAVRFVADLLEAKAITPQTPGNDKMVEATSATLLRVLDRPQLLRGDEGMHAVLHGIALLDLCASIDEGCRRAACEADAVEAVVALAALLPQHAQMQMVCCRFFWAVCAGDVEARHAKVLQAGALAAVLAALREHRRDPQVVMKGVLALQRLTSGRARDRISPQERSAALAVVADVFAAPLDEPTFARTCCHVAEELMGLGVEDTAHVATALLGALRRFPMDVELHKTACWTLCKWCDYFADSAPPQQCEAAARGVVAALDVAHGETCAHACSALLNVAQAGAAARAAACEAGSARALVRLLHTPKLAKQQQEDAYHALLELVRHEEALQHNAIAAGVLSITPKTDHASRRELEALLCALKEKEHAAAAAVANAHAAALLAELEAEAPAAAAPKRKAKKKPACVGPASGGAAAADAPDAPEAPDAAAEPASTEPGSSGAEPERPDAPVVPCPLTMPRPMPMPRPSPQRGRRRVKLQHPAAPRPAAGAAAARRRVRSALSTQPRQLQPSKALLRPMLLLQPSRRRRTATGRRRCAARAASSAQQRRSRRPLPRRLGHSRSRSRPCSRARQCQQPRHRRRPCRSRRPRLRG
jgi:hypothetical protein